MKNSLLLVCLCAFIVLLTSCNEDTHVQAVSYLTGTITGKVYLGGKDGNRLSDLSGVNLQLKGVKTYTTTSAADGSYTFEKVDQGVYTLIGSAHNYHTQTRENIQFSGNGTLTLQDFPLFYKFGVSVRIFISVFNEVGVAENDSSGVMLTLSNDKGFSTTINNRMNIYLDSLPEGTYTVKAEKNGYIYDLSGFISSGRVYDPIFLRIFKVIPNNKIEINSPKYRRNTTVNNGLVDTSLIITFDAETSIDTDSLYCSIINSVSDTNSLYGWEGTFFSMGRMQRTNSNQFLFSLQLEKKAGQSSWRNTSNNTYIHRGQLFFYAKTYPRLVSGAHINHRFPKGFYHYTSKIVPFTIP